MVGITKDQINGLWYHGWHIIWRTDAEPYTKSMHQLFNIFLEHL